MHLDIYVYTSPLHTKFRGLTQRDGLLIHGPAGWGETSPFWDYDPQYSAAWLNAGIESATQPYPQPQRTDIPVNVTVPATTPQRARDIVLAGTCTTAKVKVGEPGQNLADDLSRVAAVREALGTNGKIRVDVNGAWDVTQARDALLALNEAAGGLEYAEQPVADVEDLARLRKISPVPIAADESIRRASDPMRVKQLNAADLIVVKNQPLGGVRAALEIAKQIELPVVVSSALESSIGIRAGLAFAAALPQLPYACGLATVQLLTADTVTDSLVPKNGTIAVRDVEPDHIPAPDPQLVQAWDMRLESMWQYCTIDANYTLHTDEYVQ
ncbi:o-succinylbenzoate synthase [Arcanobacterium phocisimile]|uniref:o-succinylbenzoate synthase n=1 Tax=Arcanobacterium phocisimile TaxID=1302235 RepID=A0ABX7IHI6_9ACTO|nr:o-succinylbenzoate synthase [Arcanobacterium phocisimile]QRV02446.1 o-succinylbenzoate synthase [Arcanobacterium phocisimile]